MDSLLLFIYGRSVCYWLFNREIEQSLALSISGCYFAWLHNRVACSGFSKPASSVQMFHLHGLTGLIFARLYWPNCCMGFAERSGQGFYKLVENLLIKHCVQHLGNNRYRNYNTLLVIEIKMAPRSTRTSDGRIIILSLGLKKTIKRSQVSRQWSEQQVY